MKLPYLAIFLAGCSWTCKQAPKAEAPFRPTRVKVTAVKTEQVSIPVRSSGIVELSRETRLSFKTGGIIAAIRVDEGAKVKKGDILATLNLSEVQAQASQAGIGYEKALRDFTRVRNLYTDSVVTLEQMQNAETALHVARSNLDMAEFNLDHSRIIAPGNGTILKRLAESDEMIAPGYPVFLFGTEGRSWKIKSGLADRDFVRIQSGDSALISLDAYPGVKFHGIINQIGESANPMTGTYEIEVDLQSDGHRLATGFVARLEIHPSRKQTLFVIPVEAILQAEGTTAYVFALDNSLVARRVEVEVGDIYGTKATIVRGLEKVSRVVTGGAAYLTEGDRVEIVKD